MAETIVRIAGRGEGVSESGRHVAFAVPGDTLRDDGSIEPGPHHQVPPCRHFPECGGCQLQHADDAAYRDYLVSRVEGALAAQDLSAEVLDSHLSPPCSRRRASLRAIRSGNGVAIGFNAAKSHNVIDMQECHILRPELFALVASLRNLLAGLIPARRIADVQMTLADQGVDLLLRGFEAKGLDRQLKLTDFAMAQGLARLSLDPGYGAETLWEPEPVTITLSGTPVRLPVGAFLQATKDGEQALVQSVREAIGEAKASADLFAGLGTFALASRTAYAAEASRDAAAALKQAGIAVEHRDLYRRPLDAAELKAFGAIILDPPRAGASEQCAELARSVVPRIAYVSCNPASFARDAKTLVQGGYRLSWVRPVGQFRWSTHIELCGAFSRL
jgi:23S rRNA (uracil1939-C5)-methyltransferase